MKPGWPKLSTKGYKFKVKPRNAFTSLKRTIQQFKNLQCLSLIIIHAYKHRFEYYFSRRVCSHFIGGGFTSSFKTPKNFTKRNKLTRRGNSILCKHNLQITTNKQILLASAKMVYWPFLVSSNRVEILAVYEASPCEKKIQNSPCRVYK